MTTGSWDTRRNTQVSTSTGLGPLRNGTYVTWTGADNVVRHGEKIPFKERKIEFLRDPTRMPYDKRNQPIDHDTTASKGAGSDLFSATRDRRIRVYDTPQAGSDYGTPNAFSKTWTFESQALLNVLEKSGSQWYPATGTILQKGWQPQTASPLAWTANEDYKLISRLRAKVVGSEFNAASFLGAEGYDTLRFLGDTANRIYRMCVAAKKLNFRQAADIARAWGRYNRKSMSARERAQQIDVYRDLMEAAAGKRRSAGWSATAAAAWLDWQLAIRPLLGDVVAAAEQLAHITEMPASKRLHASVTLRSQYPTVTNGPQWVGGRFYRKKVVAYFTSTPEPSNFGGFQDPEVTIWNAFPLSFVADYMLNIGGFLEARASAAAFPSGLFVTSIKNEERLTAFTGNKYLGTGYNILASNGQFEKYTRGSFTRGVSASLDVPNPAFKKFGSDTAWQRVVTIASLFTVFADPSKIDWWKLR